MEVILYFIASFIVSLCLSAAIILLREVIPDTYRDYKEKRRVKNTPVSPCSPRTIGYKKIDIQN